MNDLIGQLPTFLLAVVLISASPGPAMALIFRRAALGGFARAVPTVLGLELGIYAWALAAGAGLAALVAASTLAYTVLRVVGAVVLIVLGLRAWWAVWRSRGDSAPATVDEAVPSTGTRSAAAAFTEGLLVQLANPKAAVFMFSFYPQFVSARHDVLGATATLAGVQVLVETSLYLALAAGVGRASAWFRRPAIRRRLDAVAGAVLIGLGVRVAAAAR